MNQDTIASDGRLAVLRVGRFYQLAERDPETDRYVPVGPPETEADALYHFELFRYREDC